MTLPTRSVVILRDPSAPLWYLRCSKPCEGRDWCMRGPEGRHPPHCYLGGALSEIGAMLLANRCGYSVEVAE